VLEYGISDTELVKAVKRLIVKGPNLQDIPADPTPVFVQKLKAVNLSLDDNTDLDVELAITEKTLQELRQKISDQEEEVETNSTACVKLMELLGEVDTETIDGNLEKITERVTEQLAENRRLRDQIAEMEQTNTKTLLSIAYALPGDFDERIPISSYGAAIIDKVKNLKARIEVQQLDVDRLQLAYNEIHGIVGLVVKGLSHVLGQPPPKMREAEDLRRLATKIEKEIDRLRLVEYSVDKTFLEVQDTLEKISQRLDIKVKPTKLDHSLSDIYMALHRERATLEIAQDENDRLVSFLREMCSRLNRPVSAKASVDELIHSARGRLPTLEGSLRMEIINRMLHRRGDPASYLPEIYKELEMHERLFEIIRNFGAIFDEMFRLFPETPSSGVADFDGFLKDLQRGLLLVARGKFEPFICSFFSKVVGLVDAFVKYVNVSNAAT
jgi:hypothetical protein